MCKNAGRGYFAGLKKEEIEGGTFLKSLWLLYREIIVGYFRNGDKSGLRCVVQGQQAYRHVSMEGVASVMYAFVLRKAE